MNDLLQQLATVYGRVTGEGMTIAVAESEPTRTIHGDAAAAGDIGVDRHVAGARAHGHAAALIEGAAA